MHVSAPYLVFANALAGILSLWHFIQYISVFIKVDMAFGSIFLLVHGLAFVGFLITLFGILRDIKRSAYINGFVFALWGLAHVIIMITLYTKGWVAEAGVEWVYIIIGFVSSYVAFKHAKYMKK